MRHTAALLASVLVLVAGAAALASPLSGSAEDRLLGDDCSRWCFNGTDVLQPEVFGVSNAQCPDARGCEWQWRLSVAPCSLSLLDFEARLGPQRADYSHLDPAAAQALGFYCSESDSSVVLELRPHGDAPIMTWHYSQTSCAALMSDFSAQQAHFQQHETAVDIDGSRWFATGAERLEQREVDCASEPLLRGDLLPCEQCFRGVEELNLPSSAGWSDVCGSGASTCQAEWRFCYDACTARTSKQSLQIGSALLRTVSPQAAERLHVVCGQVRGLTVVALTDADDVEALDDGDSSVYALWEYRAADCEALWRAPRRGDLFLRRHFALEREARVDAAGASVPPSELSRGAVATGGLDDRVWYGGQSVHGAAGGGSGGYTSLETALIVVVSVVSAACVLGWLIVMVMYRRTAGGALYGVLRPADVDAEPPLWTGAAADASPSSPSAASSAIELVSNVLRAGAAHDDNTADAHRADLQRQLREHDDAEARSTAYLSNPEGERARREAAAQRRETLVAQLGGQ